MNPKPINLSDLFLRGWRPYVWLALVIVALFGPTVYFDFVCYDDNVLVKDNLEFLRRPANVGKAFMQHYFASEAQAGSYYRPLITLSYMTDTWIGGGKPWAYHATNVILHIAVTWLVFGFFRTLALCVSASPRLPFLFSLLFAVHPLHVMAAGWIPGRNDLWLSLFMLAGLLTFIRYRETGSLVSQSVHLAAFGLGLLSKESAVLLPALCAFWLWLMEGKRRIRLIFQDLPVISWIAIMFIWLFLRAMALGIIITLDPFKTFGLCERVVVMAGLAIRYAGKILIPLNMASIPDIYAGTTVYGAIVMIFLLCLYWRVRSPADRPMHYGMLMGICFLMIATPFSHTMAVRNLGLLEHRMYLPLVAFLGAFMVGIEGSGKWEKRRSKNFTSSRLLSLMLCLFVCGMALVTYKRLPALLDREMFWSRAVKESPSSSDAWHNYGCALVSLKKEEEAAFRAFHRALELNPARVMSYYNMAGVYYERGQYGKALEQLRKEVENNPWSFRVSDLMAATYFKLGDPIRGQQWRARAEEMKRVGLK